MSIKIALTRQNLADAYGEQATASAPYVGLHTNAGGADPGADGTVNEVTGGSPAYVRKQTTWTPGSGGTLTGTPVTIDVPAGTYTHASLWTVESGTDRCIDWVPITTTQLGAQGQIVVTPTYAQA